MKNLLESFAVLLVGVLSLLIVFLIVQYNMIKEDNTIDNVPYVPVKTKKKESTKDYLSDMEKYADVDVEVDPTKEDTTNSVVVKSELTNNTIDETIEDKSKSSYMSNLTSYSKEKEEAPQEIEETPVVEDKGDEDEAKKISDGVGDENQMKAIEEMDNALDSIVGDDEEASDTEPKPMKSIDDEIGQAIDAVLSDL